MMLQFTALRAAAAGEPILPFFDYLRGLADLVSRRSRYVPDWVWVFYMTVYIEADRLSPLHVHGSAAASYQRGDSRVTWGRPSR
jgi:hypothetical protein